MKQPYQMGKKNLDYKAARDALLTNTLIPTEIKNLLLTLDEYLDAVL